MPSTRYNNLLLEDLFANGDILYGLCNPRFTAFEYLIRKKVLDKDYLYAIDLMNYSLIPKKITSYAQEIYEFVAENSEQLKVNNMDIQYYNDIKSYPKSSIVNFETYKNIVRTKSSIINKRPDLFTVNTDQMFSSDVFEIIIRELCTSYIAFLIKKGKKIHFILDGLEIENKPTFEPVDGFDRIMGKQLLPSITISELLESYKLYKLDPFFKKNILFYRKEKSSYVKCLPPWMDWKHMNNWKKLINKHINSDIYVIQVLLNSAILSYTKYVDKYPKKYWQVKKYGRIRAKAFVRDMLLSCLNSKKRTLKNIHMIIHDLANNDLKLPQYNDQGKTITYSKIKKHSNNDGSSYISYYLNELWKFRYIIPYFFNEIDKSKIYDFTKDEYDDERTIAIDNILLDFKCRNYSYKSLKKQYIDDTDIYSSCYQKGLLSNDSMIESTAYHQEFFSDDTGYLYKKGSNSKYAFNNDVEEKSPIIKVGKPWKHQIKAPEDREDDSSEEEIKTLKQ
jgi:hypothetical protein